MEKITNDVFRNLIVQFILWAPVKKDIETNDELFIYYICNNVLNDMRDSENPQYRGIYESFIEIAFLDAYKILNAKNRECLISNDEKRVYDIIAPINSFEELEMAIDSDEFLLEELLKYLLDFYRYDDLRKITTVKKLSVNQKDFLTERFNLFSIDLKEYDYREKMPMTVLTDYYQKEMAKYENAEKDVDTGAVSSDLIESIIGFIKMLAGYSPNTYEQLMSDIIVLDYKWNKYIIDNNLDICVIDLDDIKRRIKYYDNFLVEEIVKDEILLNEDYLEGLITSLISIKCDNLYVSNKVINDDIVEKHYRKIMERKLKNQ